MYEPLRVGLGLARSRSVKLRAFFDWKSRPFELRPARPLMRALYVLCLDLTALRLTPSKAAVLLYGRSFKLLNDRTVATPRRCRNIVFCFAVRKVFLWISQKHRLCASLAARRPQSKYIGLLDALLCGLPEQISVMLGH